MATAAGSVGVGVLRDAGDPLELSLAECVRRVTLLAAAPDGIDGAGCLLMDGAGALRFVSASDAPGQVLEIAEELCVEGPCHETFARGDTIVEDLPRDPRWTRLGAVLSGVAIHTVIGVPVVLEGGAIGSLNAFANQPRTWCEADLDELRACAGTLTAVLEVALDARLDAAGDVLTAQIRAALEHRDLLGRAAAVGAADAELSLASAALRLRQLAAVTGMTAVAVAEQVLERGRLPAPAEVGDWVEAERHHRGEMARLALTDPLTGLANRTLFLDRLEQALIRGERSRHRPAILFVDLDRFKVINDSMGHEVGDQVLRTVAARLRAAVRPQDTVARLGGDEFVVLCEAADEDTAAATVAHRVASAIEGPMPVDLTTPAGSLDQEVSISASVGVTVPGGNQRPRATEALRDADMAMYAAKRAGGHRVAFFTEPLRAAEHRSAALELALGAALQDDAGATMPRGFRLVYQPLVDVASGRVTAVEALVRWRHPELGDVPASELMAIAEAAGLIVPLGAAVLKQACVDARGWLDRLGLRERNLIVAVNVSAQQLASGTFLDDVRAALAGSGLPQGALCLEITESELLEAAGTALSTMQQLAEGGVHLTLDDFGTGYSSLSLLTRLPIQQLKIDRSFVSRVNQEPQARAVVEAVIGLARSLRLRTVAEGVETAEQERTLAVMGCSLAQGYRYSPAVPSEHLLPLLEARGVAPSPAP